MSRVPSSATPKSQDLAAEVHDLAMTILRDTEGHWYGDFEGDDLGHIAGYIGTLESRLEEAWRSLAKATGKPVVADALDSARSETRDTAHPAGEYACDGKEGFFTAAHLGRQWVCTDKNCSWRRTHPGGPNRDVSAGASHAEPDNPASKPAEVIGAQQGAAPISLPSAVAEKGDLDFVERSRNLGWGHHSESDWHRLHDLAARGSRLFQKINECARLEAELRGLRSSVRDTVIEECAKVCEAQVEGDEARGRLQARSVLTRCAASIRALKEKV